MTLLIPSFKGFNISDSHMLFYFQIYMGKTLKLEGVIFKKNG